MGVLYVNVGGSWVPVGGGTTDEVAIGPDDPVAANPNVELWYDTDAPSVGTVAMYAGRNLFDNGQMAINQRQIAALALPSGSGANYIADRWPATNSGVGIGALAYNPISVFGVNTPAGRPRPANVQALAMNTQEAAGSLAAGDWFYYGQSIEGQFLQHLNWGTADARPLTLSFDIYSPIATSYVVELYHTETASKTISKLLTVPAGWSTQVMTFPGDTATAITNDNASRLSFFLWIGAGSTWTSAPLNTSWAAPISGARATGVSNAFAAQGSPLALTNVQLEVGSVATPYEVRRFDDELAHCMRYYEKSYAYNMIPGSNAGIASAASCMIFDSAVPTRMRMTSVDFRVTKRATPTLQLGWATDGTQANISTYNSAAKISVATYGSTSDRQWACDYMTLNASAAANTYYYFHWVAGAEI